jgi:hypothetical protein
MSRIRIQNLPQDQTISKEELKRIKGGVTFAPVSIFPKVELDGKGGDILNNDQLIVNDSIISGFKF